MADKMMPPREAAARIGVEIGTLAMWRSKRKGPRFVKLGHGRTAAIRYRDSEIEEWLARHAIDPSAPAQPDPRQLGLNAEDPSEFPAR